MSHFFSRQYPISWVKLIPEADYEPAKEVGGRIWVGRGGQGLLLKIIKFDHQWNCNFYSMLLGVLKKSGFLISPLNR